MKKIITSAAALMLVASVSFAQDSKMAPAKATTTKSTTKTATKADGKKTSKKTEAKTETKTKAAK